MRRAPRPLIVAMGLVAVVGLALGVAPTRNRPTRAAPVSARFIAGDERAVFVAIADSRPSVGVGDLVGRGWGMVPLEVELVFFGLVLALGLLPSGDARRRWRALLVGAPPIG